MPATRFLTPRQLVRRFSSSVPVNFLMAQAATPLGRLGELEVRLASTAAEVRRAQQLRYRIFYEEMNAVANAATLISKRDADRFDRICDHLLVLDRSNPGRSLLRLRPEIVGTYRLLRQEVARRHFGFYTQAEFEIETLVRRNPHLRFLELGRSCVLNTHRNSRTIELLWHGIWSYVLAHQIDVMIGCASLEGTDPDKLALPLAFLHHHARAPAEWSVSAVGMQRVEMGRMSREAVNVKQALRALPPLIRGYLRLGAMVGEGAVIDRQFGTTDVCIILPVAAINPRYVNYYGPDACRHAA
jgi:putative hemolysin